MPKITINQIHVDANRRPIKNEKVTQLKESIKANGLLNPITIDKQLNLIAGLHRLTAYKQLGIKKIECHIVDYQSNEQARLAEIDENLIRNELEALERAELWLERDILLTHMGLKAKSGDNQYTLGGSETISPPVKTNLEFAQEIGYSKRTLQHGKQIAKDIAPEVKQIIKGTAIANSPTKLLQVARAASSVKTILGEAQKSLKAAQESGETTEIEKQRQILEQAEAKRKELQLITLQNILVSQDAKLKIAPASISVKESGSIREWILGRHQVYSGDTTSSEFINLLLQDASLAIATLSSTWNHDYLIGKAKVVAVLRSQGYIYQFCRQQQMNFQYEFVLGSIYVGIFAQQSIPQPPIPIQVEGVEGIINYLLHLYTSPNDLVVAPFMGQGEILVTCERMGRICLVGDRNREFVHCGLMRWQNLTGMQPQLVRG